MLWDVATVREWTVDDDEMFYLSTRGLMMQKLGTSW